MKSSEVGIIQKDTVPTPNYLDTVVETVVFNSTFQHLPFNFVILNVWKR